MSLAILFNFLRAQHVSDINMSIIRSLRLFCGIATLVVLFLVRCVLEFRCGWFGVVSVLQASVAVSVWLDWSGIRVAGMCWNFCVVGLEWYPCCRRVLEFRCCWLGVVSVLQASDCNTDTTRA